MILDLVLMMPSAIALALPTLAALALLAPRSTRAIGIGLASASFVLAAWLSGFDAVPAIGKKFDFTSIMWFVALERRVLAGVCALVLALPAGAAIGQRMGRARAGALLGLVTMGAPGTAMIASGASLILAYQAARASLPADLGMLRGAVDRSSLYLGIGALVGVIGALTATLVVTPQRAPSPAKPL